MNPPSTVLGRGVHGKVSWLIAYIAALLSIIVLQRCNSCLTYVACLLTRYVRTPCILDSRRMGQFVSLYTAHLCIFGVKLCYSMLLFVLFLNDFCFVLLRVLPDIHHNILVNKYLFIIKPCSVSSDTTSSHVHIETLDTEMHLRIIPFWFAVARLFPIIVFDVLT